MFQLILIAVVGLIAQTPAFADDKTSIDPTRPFLKRLLKEQKNSDTEYEEPFLIVQSARRYDLPYAEIKKRLKDHLKKAAVVNSGSIALPKEAVTGAQLKGIQECSQEYCLMKLLIKEEIAVIEKSQDKLKTYQDFIQNRIAQYTNDRQLIGYEIRKSNIETIKSALKLLPSMKERYPKTFAYLVEGLWKKGEEDFKPRERFLRHEMVDFKSERMQPIYRLGEVLEFEERNSTIFGEIHIYTNHYFDSSLRIIDAFSAGSVGSVVVVTDVTEIDELKKSAFIRMLFRGKMEEAVLLNQANELATLE